MKGESPVQYTIKAKKELKHKTIWFTIGQISIFPSTNSGRVRLDHLPDQEYFAFLKENKEDGDQSSAA